MRRLIALCLLASCAPSCSVPVDADSMLTASFDSTRELFSELDAAFAERWRAELNQANGHVTWQSRCSHGYPQQAGWSPAFLGG